MNKSLIIKYISGQVTDEEKQKVLDWASQCKENAQYIAKMKGMWVAVNMNPDEASPDSLQAIKKVIASNEIRKRNIGNVFKMCSAAAVLVLIAGFVGWQIGHQRTSNVPTVDELVAHQIIYKEIVPSKELYTNKGVKAKLVLPDSSIVLLNSDTRISYPESFDTKLRVVKLSGEAYFDVRKDSLRPMIVHTEKGFSIKVLGTKFNVKAYNNDEKSETTLYDGKIDLIRENGKHPISTKISLNQTAIISDVKISKVMRQFPNDDKAWTEGKIIFDETPLKEVVKVLERWHGYSFSIKDKSILDYKITATFNSESIVQIMDLIQLSSLIKYTVKDKIVYLSKK